MFSFITAHPTKVEKQNNSLSASSPSQSRSTGPALVFARIECEEHTFTCISVALQHQTSGERAAYRPLGKAGGGGQRIRASALSGECSFLFPFASISFPRPRAHLDADDSCHRPRLPQCPLQDHAVRGRPGRRGERGRAARGRAPVWGGQGELISGDERGGRGASVLSFSRARGLSREQNGRSAQPGWRG